MIVIIMMIVVQSLDYEHCVITHVNKRVNGLARNLAKVECELGEYKIWRNSLPSFICNPDFFST